MRVLCTRVSDPIYMLLEKVRLGLGKRSISDVVRIAIKDYVVRKSGLEDIKKYAISLLNVEKEGETAERGLTFNELDKIIDRLMRWIDNKTIFQPFNVLAYSPGAPENFMFNIFLSLKGSKDILAVVSIICNKHEDRYVVKAVEATVVEIPTLDKAKEMIDQIFKLW